MPKKLTQEEFVEKSNEAHGNGRFDYSSAVYTKSLGLVEIGCNVCGLVFKQQAADHYNGHGCPRCKGRWKSSTQEFIRLAEIKFGKTFDYTHVNYKNAKSKVCIICKEHGEFWQTPQQHLSVKYGCRSCGYDTGGESRRVAENMF